MFKRLFENVIKPKENMVGRFMVKGINYGHEKLAEWGRSFLNIDKANVVLDLGCGGGRNVQYFLTQANKVYGIDYSKTSVQVSTELNQAAIDEGRCEIIYGDVRNLPFEDGSINIVTAFETIYFWQEIDACFKEIDRVLAPGGQFLICNEGAYRDHRNIKKWADLLSFEVYSPKYLTEKLTVLGFTCDYHLNKKDHLVVLAKKS